MFSEALTDVIIESFRELLPSSATKGAMSYARFLPSEALLQLIQAERFAYDTWEVYLVSEKLRGVEPRIIGADRAVEIRENKGSPVLLLVDNLFLGSGLDGIFSAAREITESVFYRQGREIALNRLGKHKDVATYAVTHARKLGASLSPHRELEFYVAADDGPEGLGKALGLLGIWPVANDVITRVDVDRSIRLTEHLLLDHRSRLSAKARVDSLGLDHPSPQQLNQLEQMVRDSDRHHFREITEQIADLPDLWLGSIVPGILDNQRLLGIKLASWRTASGGKLAKWTGLQEVEGRPALIVDKSSGNVGGRMEIRWASNPVGLAPGAVEYIVEVISGDDVLATRKVPHTGKNTQKCVLVPDDFDIEEGAKFEASVRVHAGECEDTSAEEFLLLTGQQTDGLAESRKTQRVRTLADGLFEEMDEDLAKQSIASYGNADVYATTKDAISVRMANKKAVVVSLPPLLRVIQQDWFARKGAVGYWTVSTFADGRRASDPEFVPLNPGDLGPGADKLNQVCRQFSEKLSRGPGILAWISHDGIDGSDYVNGWIQALESGPARMTQAFTVEVRDLASHPVGIIVLPFHPTRIAWQMGYDALVQFERYRQGTHCKELISALGGVDGAYCPMFLPKDADDLWVFADMLDFHTVAMVSAQDLEPKSSVGRMARAWFGPNAGAMAQQTISETLHREIQRFRELHPDYEGFHLHGVKIGDGGSVIQAMAPDVLDEAEETSPKLRFELEVYPVNPKDEVAGSKIAEMMQQQHARGALPEDFKWMQQSLPVGLGRTVPRFSWRRHYTLKPDDSAHLAVAFNLFGSNVNLLSHEQMPAGPLLLYGLVQTLHRGMSSSDHGPTWYLAVPPAFDGGRKHPQGSRLTDRLLRLQFLMNDAAVRSLGEDPKAVWPALTTFLDHDSLGLLETLHQTSDWVVTFDRNVGFEYFDNPKEYRETYDVYIIDCVPERGDFNSLQMVTSTIHVDEVLFLLDRMLNELDLSKSVRHGRKVLDHLKMVSGRLAMRLSGRGQVAQEAVGLAMLIDHCQTQREEPWLSFRDGVLVPLDELPEFFASSSARSDFAYVTSPKRGVLEVQFVEVKFRRYRATARSAEVIKTIERQLEESRKRWDALFTTEATPIRRTLARMRLAQVLQFYLDKASRHALSDDAYRRIGREVSNLAKDPDYPMTSSKLDRGFIFCPEYLGQSASALTSDESIWLFGALTDSPGEDADVVPEDDEPGREADDPQVPDETVPQARVDAPGPDSPPSLMVVHMGVDQYGEDVEWNVSIKGNPHFLMAGLPGMGKTTALVNMAHQFVSQGTMPIIFSYHEDIDDAMKERLGEAVKFIDFASIGFNPLAVREDNPYGFIDNAGMLRDIFAAIFPDLGELQLGSIRDATRDVYVDDGWTTKSAGSTPPFHAVWDTLRANPKTDARLMTRMGELADYGVFHSADDETSLLDYDAPLVIQLHRTQNEVVQRGLALFILYRIYQEMFRRGLQDRITHAVFFDEAHRASKLKLLARLAKECRKYGLAMILASQEIKDFDDSLVQAIGTYLALRVGESDSKVVARYIVPADQVKSVADALKMLPKFQGYFFTEGYQSGRRVSLASPDRE